LTRPLAAIFFATAAIAMAALATAGDDDRKTLTRTEDVVVLPGAELPKLKGVHKDLVRAYAWKDGALAPIPFQVDERTPELEYCWTTGPEPVKDVDDGLIDADDELVFAARDSGDRAPAPLSLPAGATAQQEVALEDPRTGGRGWVYLLAWNEKDHPPPPRSKARYVEAIPDPAGGARFRTEFFEVASTGSAGMTGRPTHVRLRDGDSFGPELVSDAAHTHLEASYLFVKIDRDGKEARTALGSSYIDGPVRIVAPVALEAYLIWGNWISDARAYVIVSGHTWELHAALSVPVNLDGNAPSSARIAVELAPGAWELRNARNPVNISLAAPERPVDPGFPAWNLLRGKSGAVLTRLELDPRLRRPKNRLSFLESDSGDSHPVTKGEVGFFVDLTGLSKSEPEKPYELTYVAQFFRDDAPGSEAPFLAVRDQPLGRSVR
jgi:hypothetical protein